MTEEPKTDKEYFILAEKHSANKNFVKAIELFTRAIDLNPNLAEAYNMRGIAKGNSGDHKGAKNDFKGAIRLKPEMAEAFNGLGDANRMLGQISDSIADYDEAIRLLPHYASAFNKRGLAKLLLGRHEEAIRDFDEAIIYNPNLPGLYFNLGFAKSFLRKFEEAIVDFEKAIKANSYDDWAFNNCGNAKLILGRYTEAIKDFDEAIRLKPDWATAFFNRGLSKLGLNYHSSALEDFEEASRLNPEDRDLAEEIQRAKANSKSKVLGYEFLFRHQPKTEYFKLTQEAAVFIDICNSTEIMVNGEVDHYLKLFGVLTQIVEMGFINGNCEYKKSLGDGFMVIFKEKDAALYFSFGVLSGIKTHNVKADETMKFDIRIGIDYGYVKTDPNLDRHGACVNRASRIEGLKQDHFISPKVELLEKNRILVSYIMTRALKEEGKFIFQKVGDAHIKGFKGPPTCIYLLEKII